jgi:hypothetical protein
MVNLIADRSLDIMENDGMVEKIPIACACWDGVGYVHSCRDK